MTWSRENYEASVTSRAWACTPYSAGWDESAKHGEDLPASEELHAIFDEEMALPAAPPWAVEVVERLINPLAMCGHYSFPLPIQQICESIRSETCASLACTCYTADARRKIAMARVVYCLDAWLQDAPRDAAEAELAMRGDLGDRTPSIVERVYSALDEHTEPKELLTRRLIHRLRWWLKTLIWEDDHRDRFQLDVYGGDIRGTKECYGNPPFGDPWFAELKVPQVVALCERIREIAPDADNLLDNIEATWLCAPKAFRYVERIIQAIGGGGDEPVLDEDDTRVDIEGHAVWYGDFMKRLGAWLTGNASACGEMGPVTPVRHWLGWLLHHKLELYERHNPFARLVGR